MAYSLVLPTNQEDIVTMFVNFATTNGWTQDELSAGTTRRAVIHKGSCYMGLRWSAAGASGDIGLYQSTGYTGGTNVGSHPGDSGSGQVTTGAVTSERRLNGIGDGPFTGMHLFADSSNSRYIHAVLEYSSGLYRHFGCGLIDKIGTWTGGEYVCGTSWQPNTDISGNAINMHPWDSHIAPASAGAADTHSTMRISGMANQSGGQTWGIFGASSGSSSNDTAGNARIFLSGGGGSGDNPEMSVMGFLSASPSSGHIPLFKIPIAWKNQAVSPRQTMLLGYAPDVRMVQMENFTPGQEVVVGTDTWKIFPGIRKQFGGTGDRSQYMGFAYLKV